MKNKYIMKNIENLLSSQVFKALLFFMIIMSLFTVLNHNNVPILESVANVFSNHIFLSLCLLPLFLFLTTHVYDSFVKDIFAITRFKNKKQYIKEIMKNIFFAVTILFFIIIMLVLLMENLTNFHGYRISEYEIRNCSNLIYMIFIVGKLYIFIMLFSFFNFFLFYICHKKIILFLNFVFFAVIFYRGYEIIRVSSFSNMSFFIGDYLVNNMIYKNFSLEIFINASLYSVFGLLLVVFYWFVKNQKKDVN